MEDYNDYLKIYTDGSKAEEMTGCAFYVPAVGLGYKYRLSNSSSVYNAELMAILKALEWLEQKPPMKCIILSDSLSVIQSLDHTNPDNIILKEIQYSFKFSNMGVDLVLGWVPSHVGLLGNEKVDKLAKHSLSLPVVSCPLLPSVKDVYKLVEHIFIQKWQDRWDSSL